MSLLVMKFGGTSVEDPAAIRRTADIVAGRVAQGKQPVVVVSAMAKVTDQLLRAAETAVLGDRAGALAISSRLRVRHRDTAAELLKDSTALVDEIDQKFDSLDEILRGLAAILELTPRVTDLIVSYGELLSSRIVAATFSEVGLNAVHVDARQIIITDSQFQKAIPQDAIIDKRSQDKLLPLLAEDHVIVMGGFIASNEAGISTTLGRGGSDFTAALIGGALAAEAIEIWTDVDGIMSADPRVCPDAYRVKVISFEEAAELAYFGAKVLHPATILPAVKKNIPVLVLNSRNAACEGTRIISLPPHCKSPFKSIAVKKKLSIIDVVAGRMLMTHGYMK
jgi:aspartate kinase